MRQWVRMPMRGSLGRTTRRRLLLGLAGLAPARHGAAEAAQPLAPFGYPIRWPGRVPGDGFFLRTGYACENAAYFPGWWHTGENWFAGAGGAAGAEVAATAAGEVVFAGYDYPGAVVIVRHADALYSQYGHLDYAVDVAAGQAVEQGQRLGTVLLRTDEPERSHLHFEVRTFFTRDDVNGAAPRYGVNCGYECPPGPGYWPIDAPEHPSDLGYRNPTHTIAGRAFPRGTVPPAVEAIVAEGAAASTRLWPTPDADPASEPPAELPLAPGDRLALLAVAAGPDDSAGTSAAAYRLWYRIGLPDGRAGWVRAAVPSSLETGRDGRPSAVRFDFLPVVALS